MSVGCENQFGALGKMRFVKATTTIDRLSRTSARRMVQRDMYEWRLR